MCGIPSLSSGSSHGVALVVVMVVVAVVAMEVVVVG